MQKSTIISNTKERGEIMIYISFEGGLGNQLFQYAIGRYMEEKFNEQVYIDSSKYEYESIEFREYELNDFNISTNWKIAPLQKNRLTRFGYGYYAYLAITWLYLKFNKNRKKRNGKIYFANIYQWLTNHIGFYRVHFDEKLHLYNSWTRKKIVRGMWFYPDIVLSLGEKLKEELTVKTPVSEINQKMLNQIMSTESVAVHIRRGDFVKLGLVVCDIPYYKRCMNKMAGLIQNPTFFVFSDDINWVKENLADTEYKVVFVDNNNGSTDDMRLVYNCKHFIMSNSTFSWWGAYLGRNENKIVICPEIWAKGSKRSPLILKEWIVEKTF